MTETPQPPTEVEPPKPPPYDERPNRDCPNVEAKIPHEEHLYDFSDAALTPDPEWGDCPGYSE